MKNSELRAKCNMQGRDENGHRILIEKSEGISPHRPSLCRWDYSNKMGLTSGELCERGNELSSFIKIGGEFF